MAKKKLEREDRLQFAVEKSLGAGKWIVISGTATFFLTEIAEYITELEADLPKWAVLLVLLFVNVSIFAVAKYREGQD
jgi:membrane protein DedA with SNARE-associated domain